MRETSRRTGEMVTPRTVKPRRGHLGSGPREVVGRVSQGRFFFYERVLRVAGVAWSVVNSSGCGRRAKNAGVEI